MKDLLGPLETASQLLRLDLGDKKYVIALEASHRLLVLLFRIL